MKVFPDTRNPDVSLVAGFEGDWLGWRVRHSWLMGYHPDEPEPSEPVSYISGVGFVCADLERIDTNERGEQGDA